MILNKSEWVGSLFARRQRVYFQWIQFTGYYSRAVSAFTVRRGSFHNIRLAETKRNIMVIHVPQMI
jgi:hypothetical protein